MGIADSMRDTADSIIASYEARQRGHNARSRAVDSLLADTRKTLKGFTVDRKKKAAVQAKELASFVKGLNADVSAMLGEFQGQRKEMSEDQAKRLAAFVQELADFVQGMTKDVRVMMDGIRQEHAAMSKELKGRLSKETKELKGNTQRSLKEFRKAHADMSEILKRDLSKYVAGIASETGSLLKNARKVLKDLAGERKQMAANWQRMAATMARKRGAEPAAKVEVKAKPAAKPGRKIKVEGVPAGASVEEKIVALVSRHPEGLKASDMEKPIGIPRTRVGVIARKLVEAGKVRKEENLYFPAR